jgi:hypothetical protein
VRGVGARSVYRPADFDAAPQLRSLLLPKLHLVPRRLKACVTWRPPMAHGPGAGPSLQGEVSRLLSDSPYLS